MVIPASALGLGGLRPPSERITLGHIGVGGQGISLLRNFLGVAESESVAVCDCMKSRRHAAASLVNERRAARGQPVSGGCAQYRDFRELLARSDIDAVVIATPDHWHVPIALAAVRAGKDVYVEKPLGVALRWDQALRAEIHRRGAVFQYGTQQRSGRNFRFACELVRNGVIGRLDRIEVWSPALGRRALKGGAEQLQDVAPRDPPEDLDYDLWLGPAPWRPYCPLRCTNAGAYHIYDYALGFIAGWGVHPIDIAQWGHDEDQTVPIYYEGHGALPSRGLFDTVAIWDVRAVYPDGVELRFMDEDTARPVVGRYRPFANHGTTFWGDEGWVSVDRGGIYFSNPAWAGLRWSARDRRLYESENHYANFVECVRSRRRTICPIEVAIADEVISHLADMMIRLGRPLRWDPVAETVPNDPVAQGMLDRPLRAPWTL
jgi:predicted dehydrogenase